MTACQSLCLICLFNTVYSIGLGVVTVHQARFDTRKHLTTKFSHLSVCWRLHLFTSKIFQVTERHLQAHLKIAILKVSLPQFGVDFEFLLQLSSIRFSWLICMGTWHLRWLRYWSATNSHANVLATKLISIRLDCLVLWSKLTITVACRWSCIITPTHLSRRIKCFHQFNPSEEAIFV